MAYLDSIEATLYENWPEALKRASMPTLAYQMNREDMLALASVDVAQRERRNMPRVADFTPDFENWLTSSLRQFREGTYIKTSYGSFRECPFTYKPADRLEDALSILRWPDRRIIRHVSHRLDFGGNVHVLLRRWQDIPASSEFRVFIHEGRIIGISQYHCQSAFPEVEENAGLLAQRIRSFVAGLVPHLAVRTIVVDVMAYVRAGEPLVGLIELTPFGRSTDPCLYSWDDPAGFRGDLRFCGAPGIRSVM